MAGYDEILEVITLPFNFCWDLIPVMWSIVVFVSVFKTARYKAGHRKIIEIPQCARVVRLITVLTPTVHTQLASKISR